MSWPQQAIPGQGQFAAPQPLQVLPPQTTQGYSYDVSQIPAAAPQQNGPQPGVPGAQIAQPYYPQGLMPLGYQQPGQPQQPQAPQWPQQPLQQPQGWPQPQQPQQQYQPQPQQGAVQLSDNSIIDGPGVPPELRGRTMGEARRLYSALSQDWLQRNRAPAPPAQQSLQQQFGVPPQAPQTPAQQQQTFWQNPDARIAQAVQPVVQQAVQQALQPVLAREQANTIMQARQTAAVGMPDFQYLEPYVMPMLGGVSPEALSNPQTWIMAARAARGELVEKGQYSPQRQQAQAPQQGYRPGPGAAVPAYQAPQPYQFFTEAPTAPNIPGNGFAQGAAQPTQTDALYAARFQMPVEQYMAWKNGTGGGGGYGPR